MASPPFPITKATFQLATLVQELPPDDRLYERKLDGYRAMAWVGSPTDVRLISRNGRSFGGQFPGIVSALGRARKLAGCVVDGEIVAYEGETVSFHALQRASSGGVRLELLVFDLLAERGEDLRRLPLEERKRRLLARAPTKGPVRALDHLSDPDRALEEASRLGDEGVVAKEPRAPYRGGRTRSWLKCKLTVQDEFVVIGWTASKSPLDRLGALALATRERAGGPLRYAGRVGTGFDREERLRLAARLARKKVPDAPVPVPRAEARGVSWVSPELVVRVAYLGYTPDGVLRHPSFRGERLDLDAAALVRERSPPR